MTITVVTATANHYWADGIVGVALLLLAAGSQWAVRRGFRLIRPVSVALPDVETPDPQLARSQ